MAVFHCQTRDTSVPLSEIYCTYLVTYSARRPTAAGLIPLLIGRLETVSRPCPQPETSKAAFGGGGGGFFVGTVLLAHRAQ